MPIRVRTVRGILWFIAILLFALSFPLQVYVGNQYPALLPYAVLVMIALLGSSYPSVRVKPASRMPSNILPMIKIYLAVVFLDCGWQVALGVISQNEAASAIVVYAFPSFCYWCVRRCASDRELKWCLPAMSFAGLMVGVYFAYDSYLKLALGKVNAYSQAAFQYSVVRSGLNAEDLNVARVTANFRSFGLLESHSVSGAWVVIGALATLALIPSNRAVLRRVVILVFGTMLLMGLNFTSIVAYAVIIVLFEFGAASLLRARASGRTLTDLFALAAGITIVVMVTFWIAGDTMTELILANLLTQRDLALGGENVNVTMAGIWAANLSGYTTHVSDMPLSLLLGDGFSSYGGAKGGDIGLIETLERFGLPLFMAVVVGIAKLVAAGMRYLRQHIIDVEGSLIQRRQLMQFSISMLLLVVIGDGHYTIWSSKSILPIVFFALAVYDRARDVMLAPAAAAP